MNKPTIKIDADWNDIAEVGTPLFERIRLGLSLTVRVIGSTGETAVFDLNRGARPVLEGG